MRCYSELCRISDFDGRFDYLCLHGTVGIDTFGFDRVFNQRFYRSVEWKKLRNYLIVRDEGCDLGCKDHPIIEERIIIHHLNPITIEDICEATEYLLNPEYLICTTMRTHNAIHYGDRNLLPKQFVERQANDTCPWRQTKR